MFKKLLLFSKQKKGLIFMFFLFSASLSFAQQNITVHGNVLTEKDVPLAGVSVNVKGSSSGAMTDSEGKFSLQLSKGTSLVFSFVGYEEKEVKVNKAGNIGTVYLTSKKSILNPVVVVGYGTLRKKDFTGSSSGVSAKTIAETPPTTLENALEGRMAGVNITSTSAEPGGGINIQVRGATSLSGGNQPLYVIDGVPQYNDNSRSTSEVNGAVPTNALATLNPSDIESVEVLKDASSAAIYGSRGANGVILITTKKGKEGKEQIQLGYYATFGEIPREIPLATASQYAEFVNLMNTNLGAKPYYNGTYQVTANKQDSIYFPKPEELGKGTDWQRAIMRNSFSQNYQLTLSGGNSLITYLISGNYLVNEGVVKYSKYTKGSLRANLDVKLNDKLSAKINIDQAADLNDRAESTNSETTSAGFEPSGDIMKVFVASPVLPIDNQAYKIFEGLGRNTSAAGLINPLADLAHTLNQRKMNYGQSSLDLIYKFNNDLNLTVRGAYNNTNANNDMYWDNFTEWGQYNHQITYQSRIKTESYINEDFLTFNKAANKYNLNLVIGVSAQEDIARSGTLGGKNLSVPSGNGIYLLPLYGSIDVPSTYYTKSLLLSGFGRLSFSYQNKYLLTLTGRGDGSSKFSENKKWAFFPSVGLGWNFIEEDFFKSLQKVLSIAKVRASYGTSGNQAISPYQSLALLAPISYGFVNGAVTGVVTNTSENKNLSWETTKQADLGLDLSFLQNNYTFSFDLYRKTTDNLLQYKSVPYESGYKTALSNFGSIQNEGAEIELGGNLINGPKFKWNMNFNASTNRNKILDLGPGVQYYNAGSGNGDYTHRLTVGGALGDFWGYKTVGLLTAKDVADKYPTYAGSLSEGDLKFQDTNNDGVINDDDKIKLGNAFPNYTFGLSNNFNYGNWSVDIFVQAVSKFQILNENRLFTDFGAPFGVPSQKYLSDYWTPENKNAYYPRPSLGAYAPVTSDRLIKNGSYVRIRTLTVRYNFSKLPKWTKKIECYLTANNLYTFTKYDGYDPEVSGYGQNILTPGIDVGSYPRTRMWTIGVNLGL